MFPDGVSDGGCSCDNPGETERRSPRCSTFATRFSNEPDDPAKKGILSHFYIKTI
eukprot:COSAG06_NODE_23327_length_695_cov_1.250000_1_plen_54_part_01